jgi:excisionase family DNA binding protein
MAIELEEVAALLTAPELCKKLRISRTTFDRWVRDNLFPQAYLHVGNSPRWKREDVNAWLNKPRGKAARTGHQALMGEI